MAFTQEPTNYAVDYAKELANAYPYLMYASEIYTTPNNSIYRPLNGKSIQIPSMTTSGARAVNRDGIDGVFSRNFNSDYESKDMQMYREWPTSLDPMDVDQTNMVYTIANATKTFNQFEKTPEMDAYAFSKVAGFATTAGNVDTTVLTKENILEKWDAYLQNMVENRVPMDGIVCYMPPPIYKLLKEAAGITRFVDVGSNSGQITRLVASLDGVKIKQVPSNMMQTVFDFTVGWVKGVGAKQINMLFVHPLSIIAPIIYETSMITPPAANTKGKWLYYESYYYDVFVLSKRTGGLYVNTAA